MEEPDESSNGSRLENLSIQDFVDQYHFNPERLERVVLELEEENRLNQVEGFHSHFHSLFQDRPRNQTYKSNSKE